MENDLNLSMCLQVHSARLTESAARAAGAQRQCKRSKRGLFSGFHRWATGGRGRSVRREVVVKVQRPGAKQLVLRDLATLHTFANLVGRDISLDVDMVMTEVMSRVKSEFDFKGEAAVQVCHKCSRRLLSIPFIQRMAFSLDDSAAGCFSSEANESACVFISSALVNINEHFFRYNGNSLLMLHFIS